VNTGTVLAKAEHFYFSANPAPFPLLHPSLDQTLTLLWHAATLHNSSSNPGLYVHLLHDGFCTGASYSRDGRHLATVSDDTKARLWDARTGESTLAPLCHDGP